MCPYMEYSGTILPHVKHIWFRWHINSKSLNGKCMYLGHAWPTCQGEPDCIGWHKSMAVESLRCSEVAAQNSSARSALYAKTRSMHENRYVVLGHQLLKQRCGLILRIKGYFYLVTKWVQLWVWCTWPRLCGEEIQGTGDILEKSGTS